MEEEVDGFWWLPGNEDVAVPGRLSRAKAGKPVLKVLQPLAQADHAELTGLHTIWGVSEGGKKFSLSGNYLISAQISFPGAERQTWESSLVVGGSHVDIRALGAIRELRVQFLNLDVWLARTGIKVNVDRQERAFHIDQVALPSIDYSIREGFELRFHTVSRLGSLRAPLKEASVSEDDWVVFAFPDGTSFDKAWEEVWAFRRLFTLLVGERTQIVSAQVRVADGDEQDPTLSSLEGFFQESGKAKSLSHPTQTLLRFAQIESRFDDIYRMWSDSASRIGPSMQLYFRTVEAETTDWRIDFLLLAQAAESLHRRTSNATELSRRDHKTRLNSIVDPAPSQWTKWLKEKLAFSNELTFAERLRRLFVEYSLATEGVDDVGKLVQSIRDTRNYFTHWTTKLEKKAASGFELVRLTNVLKTLLEEAFLRQIGLSASETKDVLSKPMAWRTAMKPAKFEDEGHSA